MSTERDELDLEISRDYAELSETIWRVETQDFGGYSSRDASAVARALLAAGYRKQVSA